MKKTNNPKRHFIQLIIGLLLLFNLWGGNLKEVINSVGLIVLVIWLVRIAEENTKISQYHKKRIFFEGLHSFSLSIIAALVVVLFIQRDVFLENTTLFFGITILSLGALIISEVKLGEIRSRNESKERK